MRLMLRCAVARSQCSGTKRFPAVVHQIHRSNRVALAIHKQRSFRTVELHAILVIIWTASGTIVKLNQEAILIYAGAGIFVSRLNRIGNLKNSGRNKLPPEATTVRGASTSSPQ